MSTLLELLDQLVGAAAAASREDEAVERALSSLLDPLSDAATNAARERFRDRPLEVKGVSVAKLSVDRVQVGADGVTVQLSGAGPLGYAIDVGVRLELLDVGAESAQVRVHVDGDPMTRRVAGAALSGSGLLEWLIGGRGIGGVAAKGDVITVHYEPLVRSLLAGRGR
jgi:hypothetical protein